MDVILKSLTGEELPDLGELGNIAGAYRHHQRLATPGTDISFPGVYLKWYNLRRPEVEISQELVQESRDFLQLEVENGKLRFDNQLGFVILHHCSSVVFLIVSTWHNTNELWKTLYMKDLENGGDFQLFEAEGYVPAFCVWELAPVWHESLAWSRYLYSKRNEEAKYAYLNDRLEGLV
jgi:hypothetical protein